MKSVPSEAVTRWRRLKFGLMMHWGIYSVAGGVWKGNRIDGYNEQIKNRAQISWSDYLTLLPGFTAEKWNPDAVAQLAKDAGMRYVVITSKHHDGFNLWHTKLSDFNAVDATPAKKDVLKLLADACERNRVAFGVYYSLIDWHYPGAEPMSNHNSDPITPALEAYTVGQLRELLTGYGPLCEIWFDMSKPTPEQSRKFADLAHSLQPDCLLSGRIWNGRDDFMECGDNETPDFWFDGPWESPVTMFHDTWGYRSWQERGDPAVKIRERIRDLAFITARGGNYLLNIGPRGDGSIVEFDAEVLRGIGCWMKVNGEAIYDSEPDPHLKLDFGYAAGCPGRFYLYVANPPADGVLRVPGWLAPLPKARVLGAADSAGLACAMEQGTLTIRLPADQLDPNLTIMAVDYAGDQPYLPKNTVAIAGSQPVELPVASSLAWHRMLGADYYSQRKFVSGREWIVQAAATGDWTVTARREKGGAPAGFLLTVGDRQTQFILPESATAQEQICARIHLPANRLVTVKVQDIMPGCELAEQGVRLTLQSV